MNAAGRFTMGMLALAGALLPSGAQMRPPQGSVPHRPPAPWCKASELSQATDDENGSFNGTSHSGTLLVLRNLSPSACRVAARPQITFMDGTEPLPIKLEIPGARFMHPGPAMLPVVIAPDAEVTSKLHWVSGEVYDENLCFTPTAIAVKIGDDTQQATLSAHICGDKAKDVTFQATPLVPDPQYKP